MGAVRPAIVVTLVAFALATVAVAGPEDAPAATRTVIVARHAEKETGAGADPPLSPAGEARARDLDRVLADVEVAALVSTPYRRTRDSLAPLARRTGLAIRETAAGADPVEAVLLEIERCPPGLVVVSGHSNTVPAIVSALSGRPVAPLDDPDYDDLFVVVPGVGGAPGTVVHLHYGAPSP